MKDMQHFLIKCFAFFGPLGRLIPISDSLYSLRFFYILLPVGTLIFLFYKKGNQNLIKRIGFLLPAFFYVLLSSFVVVSLDGYYDINNENPIIRFFLFLLFFMFTVFAANIVSKYTEKGKIKLIYLYIIGYLISLLIGYVMFIGYYLGAFSVDTLERFHVLLQFGYGIMRFSPGSYPNEYGIVTSFVLSIFTFLLLNIKERKLIGINNHNLLLMYGLILLALLLTTTRAAYIAYFITVIYLIFRKGQSYVIAKRFLIMTVIVGSILFALQNYVYDILDVFTRGAYALSDEQASAYQRIHAWKNAMDDFTSGNIFWGLGFGMANYIHNVYFQLFFELGLLGFLFLFVGFVLFCYSENKNLKKTSELLRVVKNIGIWHVSWFAISNHNLNHHLTWFVFLLYLGIKWSARKEECFRI